MIDTKTLDQVKRASAYKIANRLIVSAGLALASCPGTDPAAPELLALRLALKALEGARARYQVQA